jgi:predicted dehydrogenase
LLGPVTRVTGSARISFPQRVITSEKKRGQMMDVEVPTHVTGIMDFASGAIGTIVTSFDSHGSQTPFIEIFGSEATLSVPNPNMFGGPVRLKRKGQNEWEEVPLQEGYTGNARGLGVSDMADALHKGRAHLASGKLAYHVLDLMHAFHDASDQGRHIMLESTCDRPVPVEL